MKTYLKAHDLAEPAHYPNHHHHADQYLKHSQLPFCRYLWLWLCACVVGLVDLRVYLRFPDRYRNLAALLRTGCCDDVFFFVFVNLLCASDKTTRLIKDTLLQRFELGPPLRVAGSVPAGSVCGRRDKRPHDRCHKQSSSIPLRTQLVLVETALVYRWITSAEGCRRCRDCGHRNRFCRCQPRTGCALCSRPHIHCGT
jgi:hypothetical protein